MILFRKQSREALEREWGRKGKKAVESFGKQGTAVGNGEQACYRLAVVCNSLMSCPTWKARMLQYFSFKSYLILGKSCSWRSQPSQHFTWPTLGKGSLKPRSTNTWSKSSSGLEVLRATTSGCDSHRGKWISLVCLLGKKDKWRLRSPRQSWCLHFVWGLGVLWIGYILYETERSTIASTRAQEHNPPKMYFWFLFVLMKYTVHQNDIKSLTSSFSVALTLGTSLKYSSTSGNTPGIMKSLRKMETWYEGT